MSIMYIFGNRPLGFLSTFITISDNGYYKYMPNYQSQMFRVYPLGLPVWFGFLCHPNSITKSKHSENIYLKISIQHS
ncbi:hypothetical protein Hanom_Chr07g00645361 [Helianthus anomalus]